MAVTGTANPRFFNYPSLMPYLVAAWLRIAEALGLVAKIAPLQVLPTTGLISGAGMARTTQPVLFVGGRGISVCSASCCASASRAPRGRPYRSRRRRHWPY